MCNKIENSVTMKMQGEKMVGFGTAVLTSVMTIIVGKYAPEYLSQGHTPVLDLYFWFLCFVILVAGYITKKGYAKIERAAVLEKAQSSEKETE